MQCLISLRSSSASPDKKIGYFAIQLRLSREFMMANEVG
jgi:hypothetical protein